MGNSVKGVKEDLSIEVIERMFAKKERTRIVIAPHPVHGTPSSSVPYLDLAEALTCPSKSIHSIILRSPRAKKYCSIFMMKTEAGVRPTLCIFEEGIIHVIMKLQPSRCQNPDIADKLDEIQDELIQILRDVLHGYQGKTDNASIGNAKVLGQLINVANKTKNKQYLDILNQQIELLSGQRVSDPQASFDFKQ